ncbi:Hsp33 family molecular chaperone HslO [Rhodobacteraceae bacterium NNCM2]|nr:Hsp33 family molecular chaperone HslO [Coraliihabitans acroporae]
MTGDDSILPFQLDRAQMRGRVVRLDRTLDRILEQHRYPPAVCALVAEAALLTALIGAAMKLRWSFSIQIRGEGAVRLIATDYFAPEVAGEPGRLRAYASYDTGDVVSSRATPFELLGRGVFGVTIDQGPGTKPYQGITPLTGSTLAHCAEAYFAQSEQIATRFTTLSAHAQEPGQEKSWRAGAIMVQQLGQAGESVAPDAPSGNDGLMTADDVVAMGAGEEDWNRVNHLLATVDAHELVGPHLAMEGLLTRLFHEEGPRVYPAQSVVFGCTCSPDRVRNAMAQYSAKDIAHMTNEEGRVTADCQFCSAHYEFDPLTLGFEAKL